MITLTYRCRQILNKIIDAKRPLLIKELADDFQVSARAIKYDLDTIRLWLQENSKQSLRLEAKPNRGIWLDGDRSLITQLFREVTRPAIFLNHDERVRYITLIMLVADHYVTISDLADIAGVSRNTIAGDLQEVERFLQSWNMQLERKAYHGLRVTADETDRRLVLAFIAQSFLSGSDTIQLIHSLMGDQEVPSRIIQLVSNFFLDYRAVESICKAVKSVAKRVHESADIRLSERALLGLFVRMCVVIQRIQTRHSLQPTAFSGLKGSHHPLYSCIQQECAALAEHLGLEIPESEIQYIWLQWLDLFSQDNEGLSVQGQPLAMTALTAQLIAGVSQLTRIPFDEDSDLFDNLLAHLTDRLAKYRHRVLDPNPMVAEITRFYSDMFRHVKQACINILGGMNIFLNDADTAYLVLHFQAAYERRFGRYKYKALIVCGTGRGSARLLKAKLENEIKNLLVTGCCSIMELEKVLHLHAVDLVISVLPVETDRPAVVINTIPTKKDIEAIHQVIKGIYLDKAEDLPEADRRRNTLHEALAEYRSNLNYRDLPLIEALSQEIINQGFQIGTLITTRFKQYLTEQAAAGLIIHILLMVNRLAFNSPYTHIDNTNQPESERATMLRQQLTQVLHEHYPGIPDNEITAILRYFS